MPIKLILFALVAVIQLAIPAWMIVGHERVLNEGEVFKFRTAPVDPRDPFRGEYVYLEFDAEQGKWPLPQEMKEGSGAQHAYALLGTDSAGFARIDALVQEKPSGAPYLAIDYMSWTPDTLFGINLPFDRFYLEEGDGKKTEDLLAPQWSEGFVAQPLPAYAAVRILNGEAVIEDLIVGDKSIYEWLKEEPKNIPQATTPADTISVQAGS